jgi:dUTP pyrophosphatase
MAAKYTLELFPNESVWNKLAEYMGGTEFARTDENAGVDLFCVEDKDCPIGQVTLLDLGVKARMLDGSGTPCHYWLAPRSSIWKHGVTQANSIGVIDSSYRGPLMGGVLPFQFQAAAIKDGARLFQVLAPDMGHISKVVFRHQSELDVTARGSGGFGSSGLSGQMVPSVLSAVGSSGISALSGLAISPKLVNQTEGFVPTSPKPVLKAEDLDV